MTHRSQGIIPPVPMQIPPRASDVGAPDLELRALDRMAGRAPPRSSPVAEPFQGGTIRHLFARSRTMPSRSTIAFATPRFLTRSPSRGSSGRHVQGLGRAGAGQREPTRAAGPPRTSSTSTPSRDIGDGDSRIDSSRRFSPGAAHMTSPAPACTRLGSAGQSTSDWGLRKRMR